MRKYRNRQWLEMQYNKNDLSANDIADMCSVSAGTIFYWLHKFSIQLGRHSSRPYKNKEWLKSQYDKYFQSSLSIAEECNVTHHTIIYWLEKFGIERRTDSEACRIAWEEERYDRKEFIKSCEKAQAQRRHNISIDSLSKAEKGYIAGCIDCDGSLGLYPSKNRYSAHVSISNTDRRMINFLLEKIGGGNTSKDRETKTIHTWFIHSRSQCLKFLKGIRDFLVIKQNQCDILIDWCERKISGEIAYSTLKWAKY